MSDSWKFCGLGVTYVSDTPYGVQIRLLNTGQNTPAQQVALQDGDILSEVYQNGAWQPVHSMQDFSRLLGGMEGQQMPMRIIRGVPLPADDDDRPHAQADTPPRWENAAHSALEVNPVRGRIHVNAPADLAKEDYWRIPWRNDEDMMACSAVGRLEVDDAHEHQLAQIEPPASPDFSAVPTAPVRRR